MCCALFVFGNLGQREVVAAEFDSQDIAFFEQKVRPLLIEHCNECHSGDESNGGLLLDSRRLMLTGGDSGASFVPGEPDQSLIIDAVRYTNEDLQMPPSGRLSDDQIRVLEQWVRMGVPDPRVGGGQPSVEATGMSIADGREFWSFQPVSDPEVPVVKHLSWVRSPIDAFVLRELESRGMTPAPPADKRTLIRRVTLNLIGLPPTQDEVDEFLNDEAPDAYQRLVQRLLASPQYGVRWGRHWLDVVRYADSNGLDENLAFGTAWKYRDYVVNAFNTDKPFDRFLVEQIAGDLLPEANRETTTATGFLVLGAKVLAEPDRDKLKMDTIDEQLDATGKAFLGMTFGCVRCHDHKFDPIKQSDYYSLAAIFKSTKTFGDTNTGAILHWNERDFSNEEHAKQVKAIDAEIAAKKKAASSYKNNVIGEIRTAARKHAADYLAAATQFDSSASLSDVIQIAKPLGLHPRILYHCRRHLDFHTDGVFADWHRLSVDGSSAVAKYYGDLFAKVDEAVKELQQKDPKAKKLADEFLQQCREARDDSSGFLAVPPKPQHAFTPDQFAHYSELMKDARICESGAMDADTVMSVSDDAVAEALPIHIRGSHRNLGDPVPREFPTVMRTSLVRPVFPANQSGRLELANWMASTQHPLTARVYANRIWRWHFGRGIVGSTENFGVLGDRPSNPELLDWLARALMKSGWSTKAIHRLILLSSTYQMDSIQESVLGEAEDPENRLLWKFPRQRLAAEQIRDSILAMSGQLDRSLGGKSVPLRNRQFVFNHTSVDHTKYDSLRRASYLPVIRNNLYSFFEQFDFPDPTMPTGSRASTVVAPQALLMMNSDLVMDAADELATRLLSDSLDDVERISMAYELAFARPATDSEQTRALGFVNRITSRALTGSATIEPAAELRAWSLFCQSLFASNEFIYVR